MGVISVSSTSELLAALTNANAGDTIELATGNYGSVDFDNLSFSDYVTITSADGNRGAVFSEISVSNSSFLRFDGLHVSNPSNGSAASKVVSIDDGSDHVEFLNSEVHGPVDSVFSGHYGIYVGGGSQHIKVSGNYVHDVKNGLVNLGASHLEVSENTVDFIGSDGLKFAGVTDFLVENNTHGGHAFPESGWHLDFIQFQGSSSDGIIRGNVFLAANSAASTSQGIFIGDGSYSGFLIEQNIISTGMFNGIKFKDNIGATSDIIVQYNTVINAPDLVHKASAIIAPTGSTVQGNIQTTSTLSNVGVSSTGVTIQHKDPNGSFHYNDLFADATAGLGITLEDLRPVDGSLAESFGAYDRLMELLGEGGDTSGDPGNTAPDAVDDNITTDEDASVTVTPDSLLANDSDADGENLSIDGFSQGSNGTVTLTANGSLKYTPDADYSGTDQFTYTVVDESGGRSTATVTVTVNPEQDAPTANDDVFVVRPGESIVVDVLGNDVDADNDTIDIIGFSDASNGSVTQNSPLTYTPDDGFVGTDQFTYTISDGQGGTDSATVTVQVVDFPPPVLSVGTNEFNGNTNSAVIISDNDAYDVPDGTLEIGFNADSLVSRQALFSKDSSGFDGGGHLTILIEGDDIRVRLQSNSSDHEIRVNNVIDANQDHHLALTFGSGGMKLYLDGTLVGSNGYTGGLQGNAEPVVIGANQWGSSTQSSNSVTDAFDGTIDKVNLYAQALTQQDIQQLADENSVGGVTAGDDALETETGQAVTVSAAQLLSNDTDADGDALTIVSVADGNNGTAVLNGDGSVTYTPASNFSGQDSFTYTVTDNNGGVDTARVTVNVETPPPVPINFTEGADTVDLPASGGTFDALGGDDHVSYGGGYVGLDGGAGSDTVDFSGFGSAIWFDLQYSGSEAWTRDRADLKKGTWREISDLTDVENVVGTVHSDLLRGDSGDNTFGYTGGFDTVEGRGGTDTADFSAFGSAVWVNLAYSGSEGWTRDTSDLENGTWREITDLNDVENVTGSDHDDKLTGDDGANLLLGGAGDDILKGEGDNDVIDGGAGTDTAVFANALNAYSFGVVGTDILVTGSTEGTDTVRNTVEQFQFSDTTLSRADLLASIASPDFTPNADVVDLPASGGTFDALGGDDHVSYGGGYVGLDGGAGSDTVDFSGFGSAIWFDLQYSGSEAWTRDRADLKKGTWREISDLTDVENVVGTVHSDLLRGDSGDNTFGYTGGFDTVEGRGGTDTADFSAFGSAVWVNLAYSGSEGWTRDTSDLENGTWREITDLNDVENVTGSDHDDKLTGDDGANLLLGGAGDDILKGEGDNDVIDGGAGTDTAVFANALNAYSFGVVGTDILVTGSTEGTDTVRDSVEQFQFSDTTLSRADLLASITSQNASALAATPPGPSENSDNSGDDASFVAWQIALSDVENDFEWSEYINFHDENGQLYRQTGTYDDGRTWEMLWDMDDSESWAEQFTVYDTAGAFDWAKQVSEYDENGQLINTTVVDDTLI